VVPFSLQQHFNAAKSVSTFTREDAGLLQQVIKQPLAELL
jgi:hypothetical protein